MFDPFVEPKLALEEELYQGPYPSQGEMVELESEILDGFDDVPLQD